MMRPAPPTTTTTTTTPGEEILSHGRAHQSKIVQGVVVDLRMCWPQEPTNLRAIPFLFQKLPEIHKVVLDSPRPLNKTTHPLIFLRGSCHQRSESVKTQHHLREAFIYVLAGACKIGYLKLCEIRIPLFHTSNLNQIFQGAAVKARFFGMPESISTGYLLKT